MVLMAAFRSVPEIISSTLLLLSIGIPLLLTYIALGANTTCVVLAVLLVLRFKFGTYQPTYPVSHPPKLDPDTKVFDVVIIGAGLSGIDVAWHLSKFSPTQNFCILESRSRIGGTWDLFRYPGIRSDSDMQTMGYSFKPWLGSEVASDGAQIRSYIESVAEEAGAVPRIKFNHTLEAANWVSKEGRWCLQIRVTGEDAVRTEVLKARFVVFGAGYYRYDKGYQPEYPGRDQFRGQLIHPQHWPEHFSAAGKRIIVIGSGATAVTVAPALAKSAREVVVVQRSPSYLIVRHHHDLFMQLATFVLGPSLGWRLARWRNIRVQQMVWNAAHSSPEFIRAFLTRGVRRELAERYDSERRHFEPFYKPWEQRLCLDPGAAYFEAVRSGRMTIKTDKIRQFTATGLELESGEQVGADVIVTATGFDMQLFGGAEISVDGKPVVWSQRFQYMGTMFEGVPNLFNIFGYFNASWALRADVVSAYISRLLNHMAAKGVSVVCPTPRQPLVAAPPDVLKAGYVERFREHLPLNAAESPWRLRQDYAREKVEFEAPIDEENLAFSSP